MNTFSPFGERSLTLVAADFDDRESAFAAAAALHGEPVSVIAPGDPAAAKAMEPDQRGIWRTLVRSHVLLGGGGALLGLTFALVLIAGWPAAASSPGFTILFAVVMGAFVGMMAAGVLTLRPDHGLVIRRMRSALARGRWAVVVRPLDRWHARTAMATLRAAGAAPLRSF